MSNKASHLKLIRGGKIEEVSSESENLESEVNEKKYPKGRNFWNTCPRNLDFLPEEPCDMGKCQECPWFIESKEYNYCFWKYVNAESNKLGDLPKISRANMATLLGITVPKIQQILKNGIKSLEDDPIFKEIVSLDD